MYVALDKNGNRIYADDEQRYIDCFCPVCGELLIHRKGTKKRAHFSHKQKSDCFMGLNKDYMSEWHIRMQSFFPKESREYRFKDEITGEVHIADVFDRKTNTVIEFQHSPIDEKEYLSRTYFHLNNGRRIAWIFDESREHIKEGYEGRLKHDDLFVLGGHFKGVPLSWLYAERSFEWLYAPRSFLAMGPNLKDYNNKYSVYVYTGENENVVQRIIHEDISFKFITLSVNEITMKKDMSTDLFFLSEKLLLSQDPWKKKIEVKAKEIKEYKAWAKACEARIKENENKKRIEIRIRDRKANGLDIDLTKCPLCGGLIKLMLSKRGINFYRCANFPECNYTEDYRYFGLDRYALDNKEV